MMLLVKETSRKKPAVVMLLRQAFSLWVLPSYRFLTVERLLGFVVWNRRVSNPFYG
jgi:hypothetical protein